MTFKDTQYHRNCFYLIGRETLPVRDVVSKLNDLTQHESLCLG